MRQRAREVHDHNPANLSDVTKQDSIILNIQRACEACIDLAMHIVSERKLGPFWTGISATSNGSHRSS